MRTFYCVTLLCNFPGRFVFLLYFTLTKTKRGLVRVDKDNQEVHRKQEVSHHWLKYQRTGSCIISYFKLWLPVAQHTLNTFHDFISSFIFSVYSFLHFYGGNLNLWITYFAKVSFNNAVKADKSFPAKVRSVLFCFVFLLKLQDICLLYLILQPNHLTKLMSSCQSSTPKPGLQHHLSRRPPRHPPEPRWLRTPPRPGRYPHLEVQQRVLKSLLLKSLSSKPQAALRHFLHHHSEVRFHLWLSEEPRTDHTRTMSGFHLTGMSMPLLESGRNTKVWFGLFCIEQFVWTIFTYILEPS